MKRFLLSLVAIVITSVCFAQDIIVKKDGSTIQAKVINVSQSEVEYEKYDNQNGRIYIISTKDLQCINYANGTKVTFVSPNYNPNIVTNETATQFSNDQQLLDLYEQEKIKKLSLKKAKKLKKTGWILGGTITFVGLFCMTEWSDSEDIGIGASVTAGGLATWAGFYFAGKHIEKKKAVYSLQSSPIYQQDFKVGKNDHLMVGVDMIKDNTWKNQTVGLGVSYNF